MTARTPGTPDPSPGTPGNGKTAQSYIAGIGASGALLAGAVVTFVFLVGAVSFETFPSASERDSGTESLGVAELSGPGSGASTTTLGETVSLLAASVPAVEVDAKPKGDGGLKGGGDGSDGGSDEGVGTGGGSDGSGTAGSDPGSDPGPSDGSNGDGDRPSGSNPRPDRGDSDGSDGSGATTPSSGTTTPSSGSTGDTSRPTSDSRGRGR